MEKTKLAEKEEELKKCDEFLDQEIKVLTIEKKKLEEAEYQWKLDAADLCEVEEVKRNKDSALLSIRERLLANREEKLKKENMKLEKEQAVLRNSKDLSTKRNKMARKEDLSLAKREQVMVRREEKLQVDQQKLENLTKRQQKLLVRAQISSSGSSGSRASRQSIGSRRSNQSGRSSFSGRGTCNSWNSRLLQFLHLGLSSDFSRLMDPKAEVSYISGHQQTDIFEGQTCHSR